MAALVLSQIPHPHRPCPVTADQLSLVGMYHNIIDRTSVVVIPLYASAPGVPNLDCAVL